MARYVTQVGGTENWRAATDAIATAVAPAGLDLIHPFRVAWYDDAVEARERLPSVRGGDGLAVLVGNTRALWPRFLEHVRDDPSARDASDPLDRWLEDVFSRTLRSFGPAHEVVFSHEAAPRRIPMQRLAVHAGFAPLSTGHLLAHPVFGPWLALRAVVIVDLPGPQGIAPAVRAPCEGCEAPCRAAFDHACEVADVRTDPTLLRDRWRPWLAIRDACPVGHAYRYSDAQIRFHYRSEWPEA